MAITKSDGSRVTVRQPAIPIASRLTTVPAVRNIISELGQGRFQRPAQLVEQMLTNARVRGVVETRLNGLTSTAIRWEPGRDNRAGRKAVELIREDWPLICTDSVRKSLHNWGLNLGLGLAQKHWYVSESSGRLIPRVQIYHPSFATWDWDRREYRIQVDGGTDIYVPSPSLNRQPQSGLGQWVVHEPFGQYSWRMAMVISAWYTWLGHEWAGRDQSRASEKLGIGIVKAMVPSGTSDADIDDFVDSLRNVNSEGVIPLKEQTDGRKFDVAPFEYSGAGYDMIHRTKDSKAVDLSVLYLGHNLTSEAKGGSYAAANVGDLIRGDIKTADAKAEWATFGEQVVADWAEANFGDPELAPYAVYETDPPSINEAAARTLQQLSQAVQGFQKSGIQVDAAALLERFRVPISADGPVVVAPPQETAQPAQETAPVDTENA